MNITPVFQNFASTDSYKKFNTLGLAHIQFANDSLVNDITFSYDGINDHGIVRKNETIELRDVNMDVVYIKSTIPGLSAGIRLFVFGDRKMLYGFNDNTNQQNYLPKDWSKYSFPNEILRW